MFKPKCSCIYRVSLRGGKLQAGLRQAWVSQRVASGHHLSLFVMISSSSRLTIRAAEQPQLGKTSWEGGGDLANIGRCARCSESREKPTS
ncbi:hypothetical protein E2C01_038354 [Portunus trituberculatus]|uniref:Uncharacterized protein n=1 Tax=Portunus trituberculatus TaxID=210409 RepID=A0A5B7FGL1_PORTR|nr:hypothetical protein [Portunus trituberculatus]